MQNQMAPQRPEAYLDAAVRAEAQADIARGGGDVYEAQMHLRRAEKLRAKARSVFEQAQL